MVIRRACTVLVSANAAPRRCLLYKYIYDKSAKDLLYALVLDPVPYQLWFVRDLMMFVLLSPVIYFLIRNFRAIVLISCLGLWLADVNLVLFRSQSLLFYAFGAIMAIHYKDRAVSQKSSRYGLVLMLWVALIAVKTYLNYKMTGYEDLTDLLHKAGIILGILAVNAVYDRFYDNIRIYYERNKPVFSYTFFIFASHEPILTIIKKSLFYFTGFSTFSFLMIYLISPVFTLLICLFTAKIAKSKLPAFYSLLTGGR